MAGCATHLITESPILLNCQSPGANKALSHRVTFLPTRHPVNLLKVQNSSDGLHLLWVFLDEFMSSKELLGIHQNMSRQ